MTDSARRLRDAARRLGGHETGSRLGSAALTGLGIALAALAALVAVSRVLPGAADAPRALLALVAAAFVAAIAVPFVLVGRAWRARRAAMQDLEEAARRTEAQAAALRQKLVPALQVLRVRDERRTGYSTDLVDAVVDVTVADVEAVRPATLPYHRGFRRALRTAAAGVAAALLVTFVAGPLAAWRGLVDVASAAGRLGPRPRPEFRVLPGDVSVAAGSGVRLAAEVQHAVVSRGGASGALEWRADDDAPWREIVLAGVGDAASAVARFEHEIPEVRESIRYRFRHAGATSDEFTVSALTAPSLAIESVTYRYPAYTGLPERVVQDGSGDLAALRGTTAELSVRATNEPRGGAMRLASGAEIPLEPAGDHRLAGRLVVTGEDTYTLQVEDVLGLTNPNPLEYRIRGLPDEAPFIRLLEPGEDRDLDEGMSETLRFSALDDYGVGPVTLVWEVSRRPGRTERRTLAAPSGVRTEVEDRHAWDLAALDLLPGDTVRYHLEVRDNNTLDGPSVSRTRDYVFRFPTLGEVFAEIDEEQGSSLEELSEVVDEAKRIEKKVEDVSREILKQGESSWQSSQEVERSLQAQEGLAENLKETREKIESSLRDLEQSEFATLEAVQKMERIRELLDEVTNREMKEALEKLREALKEQNPYERQQDLAEFDKSQEDLQKQLDRILENLKQFRFEEQMKAAVRRVEELAARQERVNDELSRVDEAAEERGKDEAAKDDAGKDDAGKDEAARDEAAKDEAAQDAESKDTADDAGEKGEDSASESKDANAQDSSESAKPREDAAGKDAAREDMKRLAQEEKRLAEETRDLEQELKELAEMTEQLRQQQDAQEMREMSERMQGKDIPGKMDDMAGNLQQGEKQEAGEQGEKALTELRQLLTQLEAAQQGMSIRQIQVSQAAINRAVRDLLSLSTDQESLSDDLANIPRNSSSSTRAFADEQQLLIRGATRVRDMLDEVAKDTPLMESAVGRNLENGLESMEGAAGGLENGAVYIATDQSANAVEQLNAVVIDLLRAAQSMSSCASGMPMSGFMQQLQELSQDQGKLNEALKQLRRQGMGSLDRRLQGQLRDLAQEQQRIRDELEQLVKEMGSAQGMLGRLDDVSKKLDEVSRKLAEGRLDDATLRDQEWALTRLLDSQRSLRERDFGKERRSETGEELGDLTPPSALPEGLDGAERDLREDLLKALERRYPPKYEDLIRRYFRELSREAPSPDLP